MNSIIIKAMLQEMLKNYREYLPLVRDMVRDPDTKDMIKAIIKETLPVAYDAKKLIEEVQKDLRADMIKDGCPACGSKDIQHDERYGAKCLGCLLTF